MTTTEELLQAAQSLGRLLAEHPHAMKFQELSSKLKADEEAQQILVEYEAIQRLIEEKLATQQPVEVEDKHKVSDLKSKVAMHPLLRELPLLQADYMTLLRQLNEAIVTAATPAGDDSGRG